MAGQGAVTGDHRASQPEPPQPDAERHPPRHAAAHPGGHQHSRKTCTSSLASVDASSGIGSTEHPHLSGRCRPRHIPASRPLGGTARSAARVVTITQLPSPDPHASRPPAPVTITDLVVVRRLAALLDSLQLSTIGPGASCPAPPGGGIRLAFLARAGGPPLAVAQGPAACGTVQFSAGGKRQPALQITDSFIPQVLKLADLHWKVP